MRLLIFFTTTIFFLLLSGCDGGSTEDDKSVRLARVGSSYLTLEEARTNIPAFLLTQDSIRSLQNYREKWVREQLLLLEARNLQLSQQKQVQQRLDNARKEILTNALRDAVIAEFTKNVTISNQEMLNYYNKYKEQLVLPERYVQFRHLETSSLSSARIARQELQANVSWPEIARKYSQNSEQKILEARKFWPQSAVLNNEPQMKRYIITLDSGAISPIQRENSLYHFVQLTNSKAKGDYSELQWFTEVIKEWLLNEKQRKHYNAYVKNLYLNAKEDNEIDLFNVLSTDTVNLEKTETNQQNE